MASIKKALVTAILYADTFDFPLLPDELLSFAIGEKPRSLQEVEATLSKTEGIVKHSSYYILKGRDALIPLRELRTLYSSKKLALAKKLARFMSFLPPVSFVGVSGGVAFGNADEDDDIDFFVITKRKTLWPTRLFLLLLLQLLGRRRVKGVEEARDLACVNMLLDESELSLPESLQNLYTAHEVIGMRPLFSRGNVYETFIKANSWVFSYLPQGSRRLLSYQYAEKPTSPSFLALLLSNTAMIQLCKFIQVTYMGNARSESLVLDTLLAFYPLTFHHDILERLQKKTKLFEKTYGKL